MGRFFGLDVADNPFVLFSREHLWALGVLVLFVGLVYLFREPLRRESVNRRFRYLLAAVIILQELALNVWRLALGEWTIQTSLPLHMCGIAMICSAIMLVRKNYLLFEFTYFWGMVGALLAMVTPDLNVSFPHFRFFQFFLGHILIVVAVLYMVYVEGFRPQLRSVGKALVVTNLYVVFIGGFNYLTGANYLFLCEPAKGTAMDLFGPWPWYLFYLEGAAIVAFFLAYLPFGMGDMVRGRVGRDLRL